jgi:hypothetical protein
VLIPWHKPPPSNSGGVPGGSISSGKGHQTATYGSRRSLGSSAQLHPPGSAAATGCTTTTTTTTSEDDVTHYYAYTQTTTSDSGDQFNNNFGSARSVILFGITFTTLSILSAYSALLIIFVIFSFLIVRNG